MIVKHDDIVHNNKGYMLCEIKGLTYGVAKPTTDKTKNNKFISLPDFPISIWYVIYNKQNDNKNERARFKLRFGM